MVEAIHHEQHPDFFKRHRKNFRYLVLEKEPRIELDIPSGSNYAFGVHSSTSDYLCGFEKQPHYHVLFECDSNVRKGYNVPCLYSTFCLLLVDCSSLVMQGEIMNRLQVAMKYNVKENNIASSGSAQSSFCSNQTRPKGSNVCFTDCHVQAISAVNSRPICCNFVQNIRHSQ